MGKGTYEAEVKLDEIKNSSDELMFLGASGAERMRIDRNGNVGIGNSSPSGAAGTTLAINGGSGQSRLALKNTSTGDASGDGFQLSVGTDGSVGIEQRENNYMALYTNATERMRISSGGNLLVGRTSAGNTGNGHSIRVGSTVLFSQTGSASTMAVCRDQTAGELIQFIANGTDYGSIDFASGAVSYNTSSDHRLKENVIEMTDATTRLKQLQPKRFNFIADADTTVDGFLAHEVQSVVPEAITGTHNEVDADGNPVYQGIDQSKLVPLLVKTIQELEARITALENGE